MPFASIERWTECPECGSGLEFNGYRENALECTGLDCDWTENHSMRRFTEFMSCPDCGSSFVEPDGCREDKVYCKKCGLREGEMF